MPPQKSTPKTTQIGIIWNYPKVTTSPDGAPKHRLDGFKRAFRAFKGEDIIFHNIHYTELTKPERVKEAARYDGLILTGTSTQLLPTEYDLNTLPQFGDFMGLWNEIALVRHAEQTKQHVLGICFGEELIARAFDAPIVPMADMKAEWDKVVPIQFTSDFLSAKAGDKLKFQVFHRREVQSCPATSNEFAAKFDVAAETDQCKIHAVKHKDAPIYGVQFHPENNNLDDENNGMRLLQSFVCQIPKMMETKPCQKYKTGELISEDAQLLQKEIEEKRAREEAEKKLRDAQLAKYANDTKYTNYYV